MMNPSTATLLLRLGERHPIGTKTSDSIPKLKQRAAVRGVPFPSFPANYGKPLTKDFVSGGANPVRGLLVEPGTKTAQPQNFLGGVRCRTGQPTAQPLARLLDI